MNQWKEMIKCPFQKRCYVQRKEFQNYSEVNVMVTGVCKLARIASHMGEMVVVQTSKILKSYHVMVGKEIQLENLCHRNKQKKILPLRWHLHWHLQLP